MNTNENKALNCQTEVLEEILVTSSEIQERVSVLSEEITRYFDGDEITVMPILTGSVLFVSDLIRQIPLRVRVEPVSVSSYPGTATISQGCRFRLPPPESLEGQKVLIVDDIYDSGETMRFMIDSVESAGAIAVSTCVLLRKFRADLPNRKDLSDFVGFDIPDKFVVGYGLDFDGLYRNLPHIGVLKETLRCI